MRSVVPPSLLFLCKREGKSLSKYEYSVVGLKSLSRWESLLYFSLYK